MASGKLQAANSVFLIFSLILCIFNLTACATIKEAAKEVAGISTKDAEASREGAIKRQFDYSYNDCHDYVLKILKNNGVYVYADLPEKNLIAAYFSESDTTTAGIFLKSVDANKTEVEVGSPSTFVKESIAEKLFYGLENADNPDYFSEQKIEQKIETQP